MTISAELISEIIYIVSALVTGIYFLAQSSKEDRNLGLYFILGSFLSLYDDYLAQIRDSLEYPALHLISRIVLLTLLVVTYLAYFLTIFYRMRRSYSKMKLFLIIFSSSVILLSIFALLWAPVMNFIILALWLLFHISSIYLIFKFWTTVVRLETFSDNYLEDLHRTKKIGVELYFAGFFLIIIANFIWITDLLTGNIIFILALIPIITGRLLLKSDSLVKILTSVDNTQKALKNQKEGFQYFLNHNRTLIIDWTPKFKLIAVFGDLNKFLDVDSSEKLDSQFRRGEHVHPEDIETFILALNNFVTSEELQREIEFRILCPNGRIIWVMEHMEKMKNRKGEVTTIRSMIFDLTLLKETQLELQEKESQVEQEIIRNQKIESLAHLAGGLAHDFNNILVSVLGNLDLIEAGEYSKEETNEIFSDLKDGALRARDLTKHLLTFSKGGAPIKKSEDLKEIITACAKLTLAGGFVQVEYVFPNIIPHVLADAGQISQVVNNILINAQQAMPEGGTVTINAEQVQITSEFSSSFAPGEFVRVGFQDTGSGIPIASQPHIFTPYYTTKTHGNGLGLATSFSIIKRHGGYLTFQTQEKTGTEFIIYLPVASNNEAILPHALIPTPSTEGKFILIMDDDPTVHRTLGRILRIFGHEYESASNGEETIQKYTEAKSARAFDLVIMDLTIRGGMGGKETLPLLKLFDPDVRAIVSSGYSNVPVMSDHQKYGFRGIITKPYTVEEVQKVLNSRALWT